MIISSIYHSYIIYIYILIIYVHHHTHIHIYMHIHTHIYIYTPYHTYITSSICHPYVIHMSSIYLVPAGGGADVQVLAVDHCRGWGESLNFLNSWGIPSRHHGCFNTKSWSSMTWMIFGYPHDIGHLHMSESFTSICFSACQAGSFRNVKCFQVSSVFGGPFGHLFGSQDPGTRLQPVQRKPRPWHLRHKRWMASPPPAVASAAAGGDGGETGCHVWRFPMNGGGARAYPNQWGIHQS